MIPFAPLRQAGVFSPLPSLVPLFFRLSPVASRYRVLFPKGLRRGLCCVCVYLVVVLPFSSLFRLLALLVVIVVVRYYPLQVSSALSLRFFLCYLSSFSRARAE